MLSRIGASVPNGQQQQYSHCKKGLACSSLSSSISSRSCSMASSKPLFSFGVISDVQYADIPDGASFHGVPRYYRHSLTATVRAVVEGWQPAGCQFGVHFGDILDGYQPKDKSEEMLQRLIDAFDQLAGCRTYHMIGNHCLYNLPRNKLHEMLQIPPAADGASYYSFSPHPAWRFVVIDAYDISLLGWPDSHPRHLMAEAILEKENPNKDKNQPDNLTGVQRRFVKFGGGVSEQQLEWLERQLQESDQQGQCVVVCSHLPIFPNTCPPACLVWNYEDVLATLHRHPGVVVASIAGHTHQNGYLVDQAGVHHMVLPGVVEAPPGRDCYGIVDVFGDKLVLNGVDICMSCTCKLSEAAVARQERAAGRQQQQSVRSAAAAAAAVAAVAAGKSEVESDLVVDVASSADGSSTAASKLADNAGISLKALRLV